MSLKGRSCWVVNIRMVRAEELSLEAIGRFVEASEEIRFEAENQQQRYGWVEQVLGVPVVRPQVTETTALGAAYLAGLATGFWANPEELRAKRQNDVRFEPMMDVAERAERRGRWQRAVERAKGCGG